ncbi:MAG: hypothetical protein DLM69_02335 [Candidatus Chloroheliales bacterium]|nr:MAG: hypothetical protein DLM69_02335 [Chloroflexota bacterium]
MLVPAAQQLPISSSQAYLASLADNPTGTLLFNWLYALVAVWALIGIVTVYYRVRGVSEAWAFFGTIVGAIAGFLTIVFAVQQVASLQYLASIYRAKSDIAVAMFEAPVEVNPFRVTTFLLTAAWFLVVSLLMLQTSLPRLLAYLGLVATADLSFGFVVAALGLNSLVVYAALIAGLVGGPVFWAGLGYLLRREADATTPVAAPTPAVR